MKKIILLSIIGVLLIQCRPHEVVPNIPSVNTGKITDITATTAICTDSEVTAHGGSDVTYYVRAYVTNAIGTAYGKQKSFKTKFIEEANP